MSIYTLHAKRNVYEASKLLLDALREVHQAWRIEQCQEAEELLIVLEQESARVADLVKVARARMDTQPVPKQ